MAAAALGTAIGATVGFAAGLVAGAAIGSELSTAAASCAIGGLFSWVCLLAVLIVYLVVMFAGALGSLLGGAVGNAIAVANSPNDTSPSGAQNEINVPIAVGTYMSAFGNLMPVLDANGANALWFVGWVVVPGQNTVVDITALTGNGTMLFGPSKEIPPVPPFCWTDPTANIPSTGKLEPCAIAQRQVAAALASLGID